MDRNVSSALALCWFVVIFCIALPSSTPAEEEAPHNVSVIIGASFGLTDSRQKYIEDQLTAFQDATQFPGSKPIGFQLGVATTVTSVEIDAQHERSPRGFFAENTHEIQLTHYNVDLWWRLKFPWPQIAWFRLWPGAALGYGGADFSMVKDANVGAKRTFLLDASGPVYSLGAIVEFVYRSVAIGIDYRYRFSDYSNIEVLNGGEAFFLGEPEFDYTGHYFAIAARYYWKTKW